jgi:hypothetical protein
MDCWPTKAGKGKMGLPLCSKLPDMMPVILRSNLKHKKSIVLISSRLLGFTHFYKGTYFQVDVQDQNHPD